MINPSSRSLLDSELRLSFKSACHRLFIALCKEA